MKTIENNPSGWLNYISSIKFLVQRELSRKEVSQVMSGYLSNRNVEDLAGELNYGKENME